MSGLDRQDHAVVTHFRELLLAEAGGKEPQELLVALNRGRMTVGVDFYRGLAVKANVALLRRLIDAGLLQAPVGYRDPGKIMNGVELLAEVSGEGEKS